MTFQFFTLKKSLKKVLIPDCLLLFGQVHLQAFNAQKIIDLNDK